MVRLVCIHDNWSSETVNLPFSVNNFGCVIKQMVDVYVIFLIRVFEPYNLGIQTRPVFSARGFPDFGAFPPPGVGKPSKHVR